MSSYFINACMRQSPTPADGGVARKDFVTSPIAGNDVVYRADAYYNAAAAASLYQGHGRPLPNVVHPGYDKIGVPSVFQHVGFGAAGDPCLLYTSPSPRDRTRSRMPSSA